jgi:hypothetical protein
VACCKATFSDCFNQLPYSLWQSKLLSIGLSQYHRLVAVMKIAAQLTLNKQSINWWTIRNCYMEYPWHSPYTRHWFMSCSRVKCAYDLSDTTRGCQLYPKAETLGPISIPGVTAKGTFHTNKSYLCSNIFIFIWLHQDAWSDFILSIEW